MAVYEDGLFGWSINQHAVIWDMGFYSCLLYWDKVIYPVFKDASNNKFSAEGSPHFQYLVNEGLLEVDEFSSPIHYPQSCEHYRDHVANIISGRNRKRRVGLLFSSPSEISQEQAVPNFFGHIDEQTGRIAIELALKNSFPVPPFQTPFQDIVEFKQKRKDELREFQNAIDNMTHTFVSVGHFDEGIRAAREQIAPAVEAIAKITAETWPQRMLHTIRAELGNFSTNAIVGAAIGAVVGEPFSATTLGAAGGSVTAIAKKIFKEPELPAELRPFAYCYHARQKLN